MKYEILYRYGAEQLRQANIPEADLDAKLLLEAVCHTDRNALLVHGDRGVERGQEEQYREWIETRKSHVPLQYITGSQEFMGLPFRVSEHVLIPRQDTEILVEEVMRELHDGMTVLDMCTGSGCILLSLLHYSNHCRGVGVDISKEALQIARENAASLSLEAVFTESDLFAGLEENVKFDILVSNPPYIASSEIPGLRLMEKRTDYIFIEGSAGKQSPFSTGERPFILRSAGIREKLSALFWNRRAIGKSR